MGSEGLKRALEENGLLNYSYNQTGKEFLAVEKLQASPIFYVRGFLKGRMPLVARGGPQFKACWQSESYYTRHGVEDSSTKDAIENQKHFNMMFICSETDFDYYDIPTYFLPSWADTQALYEHNVKEKFSGLGFIGGREGREDFLCRDSRGIINYKRTKYYKDSFRTTVELGRLISRFDMLLAPPGRCFNGMCGRAFEIMACRRLCFQWYNPDTMFMTAAFFEDGKDIVYFQSFDELYDKYEYYLTHKNEREKIATNGWRKVFEHHNEKIRSQWIVSCMEAEHQKWLREQEKIPEGINKVYDEVFA